MADNRALSAALHDLLKLHISAEKREKQAQARRERASAKKKSRVGSGRGRGAKRSAWEAGIGFGGCAGGSNKRANAAMQKAGEQAAQEDATVERCFGSIQTAVRACASDVTAAAKCMVELEQSRPLRTLISRLLRNDSLLDIASRAAVYRALLKLLTCLARSPVTAAFLAVSLDACNDESESAPQDSRGDTGGKGACADVDGDSDDDSCEMVGREEGSCEVLLHNLQRQAEVFVRLHNAAQADGSASSSTPAANACATDGEEAIDGLGMCLHITRTWDLVRQGLLEARRCGAVGCIDVEALPAVPSASGTSQRKEGDDELVCWGEAEAVRMEGRRYVKLLRPKRFEAVELVARVSAGSMQHALLQKQKQGRHASVGRVSANPQKRLMRVRKEIAGLVTSLPVEAGAAIFVRADEARPDVMKAVVTGPEGTPYAYGVFEFDIILPPAYPDVPPQVELVTTGAGQVRFNPNLYNCGKVCLSLLGTWQGPGWDPKTSTLLQVLVSIQSLILVPDPCFNEPGYEAQRGTPQGDALCEQYNSQVRAATLKHAILAQMLRPPPAFADVVRMHFAEKHAALRKQMNEWARLAADSDHGGHKSYGWGGHGELVMGGGMKSSGTIVATLVEHTEAAMRLHCAKPFSPQSQTKRQQRRLQKQRISSAMSSGADCDARAGANPHAAVVNLADDDATQHQDSVVDLT